jgi:hypothetical protein
MYIPDCFAERFAELMAQEFIGIVENCPPWYGDYRDQIDDAFRNHLVSKMKYHFEIPQHKGWVCPRCGVDRTREVCPKGHSAALTGECPMIAEAQ